MPNGFWGRILFVDLSSGEIREERLPDSTYRRYLGGYGLGAHILYERIPPYADPLGPDNAIGFVPGLLTGSGVPFSGRWMVAGRSPLTGAWGDANCGGNFGPALRATGYDGIFVSGTAQQPVYLFVDAEHVEIRPAAELWGLDTAETGAALRQAIGPQARVACIGSAGEKLSLISGIVNDEGRIAARCGLGAVMGSKRLKAVVVRGRQRPPVASPKELRRTAAPYLGLFRRQPPRIASRIPAILGRLLPFARRLRLRFAAGPAALVIETFRRYGTSAGTAILVELGDTPVRNWTGVGYRDFPLEWSEGLGDDAVAREVDRPYACSLCPVACGGIVRRPDGGRGHKAEYQTLAGFGPLVMNRDLEIVNRCNEACNRAGLDTVSTSVAVALAIEAAERGWLPAELASELPLRWGDGENIVALVERIARRQAGLGDWLADGVKRAAARLAPEAQEAAMHAGGQELPMHRGIYEPGVAAGYALDPAPGRHTATASGMETLLPLAPYLSLFGRNPESRNNHAGKGASQAIIMPMLRAFDALGLCQFALQMGDPPFLEWLNTATGWNVTVAEFHQIGRRIQVMRHMFNARHGLPPQFELPSRERGEPPQPEGPVRGITLDTGAMAANYFHALGLDPLTGWPLPEIARELGLDDATESVGHAP